MADSDGIKITKRAVERGMALYLKDCNVSCKYSWDELQALCRRHKLVCKQLAVTEDDFNDYVVDYLCNYRKIKGQEFFLVKWKGYSESGNTWEPFENLKCPKILQQFRHDMRLALLRSNRPPDSSLLNASAVSFILQRAKQHIKLRRWEEELNRACRHRGRIFVRNDVDLDGPPTNFTYINSNKIGEGVESSKSAIGCKCTDCIKAPVNGCCAGASDNCTAYNDKMQVKIRPGMPIYECNSRCQCEIDCRNRVVQRGIQYDLCIFKTANGRGWGVRTLERIPKNSFVMEYLGERNIENQAARYLNSGYCPLLGFPHSSHFFPSLAKNMPIITSEEAERRGQIYDQQGVTYLFDLDYVVDVFTVDAAHYGNISHFVNHSCDPNLQVYNVFIDVLDERLPRIAFFAKRAIRAGEELNFDYKMTIDELDAESTKMDANFSMAGLAGTPINPIHIECKCGAKSCRKYLF